jgi:hypothetical protein
MSFEEIPVEKLSQKDLDRKLKSNGPEYPIELRFFWEYDIEQGFLSDKRKYIPQDPKRGEIVICKIIFFDLEFIQSDPWSLFFFFQAFVKEGEEYSERKLYVSFKKTLLYEFMSKQRRQESLRDLQQMRQVRQLSEQEMLEIEILEQELANQKNFITIGDAVITGDEEMSEREKISEKNFASIVRNDITNIGKRFGGDTRIRVFLIWPDKHAKVRLDLNVWDKVYPTPGGKYIGTYSLREIMESHTETKILLRLIFTYMGDIRDMAEDETSYGMRISVELRDLVQYINMLPKEPEPIEAKYLMLKPKRLT